MRCGNFSLVNLITLTNSNLSVFICSELFDIQKKWHKLLTEETVVSVTRWTKLCPLDGANESVSDEISAISSKTLSGKVFPVTVDYICYFQVGQLDN
jgi:hypothetical protein